MPTKITLTPAAIDRLLESDQETALEIKQGIAIEFAKRYLTPLVTEEFRVEALKTAKLIIAKEIKDINIVGGYKQDFIESIRQNVTRSVEQMIDSILNKEATKMVESFNAKLNALFDRRISEYNKILTNHEDELINKVVDKLSRRLAGRL